MELSILCLVIAAIFNKMRLESWMEMNMDQWVEQKSSVNREINWVCNWVVHETENETIFRYINRPPTDAYDGVALLDQ